MKKFCMFFCLFFYCFFFLKAQNKEALITDILEKIVYEQDAATETYFPKGIFPVYRQYDKNKSSIKPDDNIFYNALICYTLKKNYLKLSAKQKCMVDTIVEKTKRVANFYKNTRDRQTFNFWKTNPTRKVFPNSGWINWFDKINALPDDMDDTVMMHLATIEDSIKAAEIHALMQQFVNKNVKTVKNTSKQYAKLTAYSTWFGHKMPIDFDACVMSNVLLFVQHYHLKWTKADSASLQYIVEVIKNNHHLTKPHFIAPHYSKTSIFLYHISRLMEENSLPALDSLKPKLIKDALAVWQTSIGLQEKIMLVTSLKRWGYNNAPIVILDSNWEHELALSNEAFFIANMASMAKNPYKKIIGDAGIGKFYYYCTAYNYTLLLESLLQN